MWPVVVAPPMRESLQGEGRDSLRNHTTKPQFGQDSHTGSQLSNFVRYAAGDGPAIGRQDQQGTVVVTPPMQESLQGEGRDSLGNYGT